MHVELAQAPVFLGRTGEQQLQQRMSGQWRAGLAQHAAQYAAAEPFPHIVIDGLLPPDLVRHLAARFPDLGERPGQEAVSATMDDGRPAQARKRWIAGGLSALGAVVIDAGAERALIAGRSLLPIGVKSVSGQFERGDAVLVKSEDGREIGRGLIAYNTEDAKRLVGRRTVEIEAILGYRGRDEMIPRDDLALTGSSGETP